MKQFITTMILMVAIRISVPLSAQMDYYPVPWSIWLYDEQTLQSISNANVDATISYKDEEGNMVFMESHTGVTNAYGHFVFKIGKGLPLSGTLTAQLYKVITKFSYVLNVLYNGNTKMIDGEHEVCAAGKANSALFSCDAGNAFGLGGFIFIFQPINFGFIVCPDVKDDDYDYFALFNRRDRKGIREDEMVMSPLSNLVRMRQAIHVNNSEMINFMSIGLGLGKPLFCGPDPEFIYGMHVIHMPSLYGLRYGVDLRVMQEKVGGTTATLNCENENNGGYGIRALGATGLVGYGNTGNIGVTYGNANGVGVYGIVDDPPNTGTSDFKYGISGNAGGFTPNAYAAALFGTSITTGPIMSISDRNLKKNVQSTIDALGKINRLRPATYEYLTDTPFHFSDEVQHGFIAQELESVLPELVDDVVLPTNLDYQTISSIGVEHYKAINYNGLIPILTASIQEMDAKIVRLEAELAIMNKVIEELNVLIDKMTDK